MNHIHIWRKRVLGTASSKCKSPEVRMYLRYSRYSERLVWLPRSVCMCALERECECHETSTEVREGQLMSDFSGLVRTRLFLWVKWGATVRFWAEEWHDLLLNQFLWLPCWELTIENEGGGKQIRWEAIKIIQVKCSPGYVQSESPGGVKKDQILVLESESHWKWVGEKVKNQKGPKVEGLSNWSDEFSLAEPERSLGERPGAQC